MENTNAIEDIIFTICDDITKEIIKREDFNGEDKYILYSFINIIYKVLIEMRIHSKRITNI